MSGILLTDDGRYILQLRDTMPQIFFPGHWSCIGGAVEMGETEEQALICKLKEELDIEIQVGEAAFFTWSTFGFIGHGTIFRSFFRSL